MDEYRLIFKQIYKSLHIGLQRPQNALRFPEFPSQLVVFFLLFFRVFEYTFIIIPSEVLIYFDDTF